MRKFTLEEFYDHHKGYIEVTAGYLKDRSFPFIIKACRLRPKTSMTSTLPKSPVLERWWVDEFGNILRIKKNQTIKIYYNDLTIDRSRIHCTDLYHSVSLKDLFIISKLLYCCKGIDDTTGKEVYILTFLGKDNYFRTRVWRDGQWDREVSTLYLGIYVLRMIAENLTIRYFVEPPSVRIVPNYPLQDVRHWITYLPAHSQFRSKIKSESKLMYETIGHFMEMQ